ncbi:hypothetical protein SUGI_0739430 [Cryptomeria japonica]|nr:hypothetical protein SUGI_0739430 [Cryptomeria japonica]
MIMETGAILYPILFWDLSLTSIDEDQSYTVTSSSKFFAQKKHTKETAKVDTALHCSLKLMFIYQKHQFNANTRAVDVKASRAGSSPQLYSLSLI